MKKALVKKSGATKKTTAKKAGSTKTAGKRTSRPKKEPRPYVMPKTAAELGIVCSVCSGPAIWFDYELGEKRHMQGFVCDTHKVSSRVEKLAQPNAASTVQENREGASPHQGSE